jgi:hypothetical protein
VVRVFVLVAVALLAVVARIALLVTVLVLVLVLHVFVLGAVSGLCSDDTRRRTEAETQGQDHE